MRVYQRGDWFWIAFTDALGRDVRRSLKTRDYSEARRKMHEIGLGVANGHVLVGDDTRASELIDRYLARDHGHRPATRERVGRCLANVRAVLGPDSITDLDFRAKVKAYRERRTVEGAGPRTVNKEVGILKQVIAYCVEDVPGMSNPLVGLKQLRVPRREARALTLAEVRRVFSVLQTPEELTIHSARHGCISRLAQMGVRAELRAKLAGHRSLSMHQDVYTHVEVEDALEAGRRLSYA